MTIENVADQFVLLTQTEQGSRLFVGKAGEITWHDRGRFTREPREQTSQFDFADTEQLSFADDTMVLAFDGKFTYDSAVVTREGGLPRTAGAGFHSTFTADGLLLRSDGLSQIVADYIAFRYSAAQLRCEAWEVQPELDATMWRSLLGLEIGDRVTVTLTPGGIGDPIVLDMHISKISHTITPERWAISFNGTPVDPNIDNYFTWNGDGATQGWNTGVWR